MSHGDLESSSGLASISKRLHAYSTALEVSLEVSLPSMDKRHWLEEQQKGVSFSFNFYVENIHVEITVIQLFTICF